MSNIVCYCYNVDMLICTFRPVRMPYILGVCSVWHFNGNIKCIESSQNKSFKVKYFLLVFSPLLVQDQTWSPAWKRSFLRLMK